MEAKKVAVEKQTKSPGNLKFSERNFCSRRQYDNEKQSVPLSIKISGFSS
jgi:hypothetical protein